MIINTKDGWVALDPMKRMPKYLNQRISVDHGMQHVEHQDYYAVTCNNQTNK